MSSCSQTRQAAAAASATQPPQGDYITVNWVFFDKSHPYDTPLPINIPRQLFESNAFNCLDLFVAELLERIKFRANLKSIRFWQPNGRILADGAINKGWTESIKDAKDHFKIIPFPISFATCLNGVIDDADCIHLIVTATGSYLSSEMDVSHEVDLVAELPEFRRYREIIAAGGPSPSAGTKSTDYLRIQATPAQAIYDGRHPKHPPFETVAPPVQIFHPIFDTFLSRHRTVQPSKEDFIKTQDLMHVASEIYGNKTSYASELRDRLSDILDVSLSKEENTDGTSADGVYVVVLKHKRIPIFILEFGQGGSDASTQAGLSMKRSWIQKDRNDVRNQCCCPTLILAGGGSWLCVLGGVFTDKVIIQRLTDMMWIAHSSAHEDPRVYQLAQTLTALRESLLVLETFYKSLSSQDIPQLRPNEPHPRFFPYPTSFLEGNETVRFKYVKPLEDNAKCVVFLAQMKDNSQVVVKFVDRYGRVVHEFLAERGYAPRLRYCGPFSLQPAQPPLPNAPGLSFGPLQMVVMDYVEPVSTDLPQTARPQIEQMLRELHKNGYVFGHLLQPNIILNQANKIQLIDFDWAGRYDMTIQDSVPDDIRELIPTDILEATDVVRAQTDNITFAHYPLNLSKNLFSSTGAGGLQPIRPIHDWRMLSNLTFTQ